MHFSKCTVLGSLFAIAASMVFSPIEPPSYPLAVRNPYLSAWLPGSSAVDLPTTRAQFWTDAQLNWAVIARVDGDAYNLFGVAEPVVNTTNAVVVSATYTSSHSVFVLQAGGFNFTLDFFSPIDPKDYVRQSLPFSYLTVSSSPIDQHTGQMAKVQIYSDFDDSWNGQNLELIDQKSSWNLTNKDGTLVYEVTNVNGAHFAEGGPSGQMALWGSGMMASKASATSKLTASAGQLSDVRSKFASVGVLGAVADRAESLEAWQPLSVMGFSHDLGYVHGISQVTFAVGYYRDCTIEYLGGCQVGYFRSQYDDPISAAEFFVNDYENAQARSVTMDAQIESLAIRSAGKKMADIVALSARQTFGGIDLTISEADRDTNNAMFFLKEISSDGNVNTLDVIYPAFPQFYVLDPEYIRLLLEPIMQYLSTGRWPQVYAIHDMGGSYPVANGHDDGIAEIMPIEESGNLLIMANIYQTATGNKTFAAKYASIFEHYADYLVANGLYPGLQLSSDDFAGSSINQTNLAIKAAVGLTSYGAMTGNSSYTKAGQAMAHEIYDNGLGMDSNKSHFSYNYGSENWGMAYNVFPDFMMKLNTFNPDIYDTQSAFYPTVRSEMGIPLSDGTQFAKTDWTMWVAMTSSVEVRDMMVADVHAFLASGKATCPFPDEFMVGTDDPTSSGFMNRPVVGGEWAGLAILDCDIAPPAASN